jgi:hypothetical protein
MTLEIPNIVGPEYLAPLLRRSVSTIKIDASRRPDSLPPRLKIPGSGRLLWLESDVLAWLLSCRTAVDLVPPVKRGRPSQVSQAGLKL